MNNDKTIEREERDIGDGIGTQIAAKQFICVHEKEAKRIAKVRITKNREKDVVL